MCKGDWTMSSNLFSTPHSIMNKIGQTYVFSLKQQQTCTSETITKLGAFQISIWFLLVFYCRFAHATLNLLHFMSPILIFLLNTNCKPWCNVTKNTKY